MAKENSLDAALLHPENRSPGLVTSRLDYGNILYLGVNKDVTRKLQVVQNAAARLLCHVPRTASISGFLRALHGLRVENSIKFKALSYMFKINIYKP